MSNVYFLGILVGMLFAKKAVELYYELTQRRKQVIEYETKLGKR